DGEETCHKQTHYADVALQRSRYLLGFAGTRPDDVVGSLRQAILVLQGKPAPGQPQINSPREALLLLAHWVGDLHQPLHVGAVYLD
ncbi:S1/P1 nuclease, partial [Acinetobacter baumannii]